MSGDLHVNDELTCDSIVCESINPVNILGTPTFLATLKEGVTISSVHTSLDGTTYVALDVALIKFGSSTSTNTMQGLDVSATSTYATDGFNKLYGVYSVAVLTHAADAGDAWLWGGYFKATGSTNGTSIVIGIESEVTALGDTTYGLKINTPDGADADIHIISSADSGDYFQIATTTNGVTTISTVDDDGEGADLIFNIDGYIDLNSASGEDITLDSGDDIFLDAAGENIAFVSGGTLHGQIVMSTPSQLSLSTPSNYTLKLVTAGTGDINLDSNGDIILDSADGNFIAKNAGTEFSAANSAYAGMIIGLTHVFGSGITGQFVLIGTAWENLLWDTDKYALVTFVVPPSNKVKISVHLPWVTAASYLFQLGLATDSSATTLGNKYANDIDDANRADSFNKSYSWIVEGSDHSWAAGETKTIYIMAYAAANIRFYTGGTNAGSYGGVIVEAIAIPATIGDGSEP